MCVQTHSSGVCSFHSKAANVLGLSVHTLQKCCCRLVDLVSDACEGLDCVPLCFFKGLAGVAGRRDSVVGVLDMVCNLREAVH